MADRTKIEWTNATWNPIRGCSRLSPGCMNCYAERMAGRFNKPGQWGHGLAMMDHGKPRWTGLITVDAEAMEIPLRWRTPRMIFVCSTSDLFHDDVPEAAIDAVFATVVLCPQHTFQILTKRPARARHYFRMQVPGGWRQRVGALVHARRPAHPSLKLVCGEPWLRERQMRNFWIGTSIESQDYWRRLAYILLIDEAAVHFISYEPALGPLDITAPLAAPNLRGKGDALSGWWQEAGDLWPNGKLAWVIAGGESGPGARPAHPDWFRSLRDQCQAAAVPFFFKQWGEWKDGSRDPRCGIGEERIVYLDGRAGPFDEEYARTQNRLGLHAHYRPRVMTRVGKKRAGRLLDHREWNEFPR